MKKGKIILFSLFLSIFMFSQVGATTIKETTNTSDEFDTIADGTIVIGITKFDSETVLTAGKAVKASYNDREFYLDDENYTVASIYVYAGGFWYSIDEENKATVITDTDVLDKLNNMNIYYVDNEEKLIEMDFVSDLLLDEGYEYAAITENEDKTITITDNKLAIPATVKYFDIVVKNAETKETTAVVRSYKMENNEYVKTVDLTYKGSLGYYKNATDDKLEATILDNKISFSGVVNYFDDTLLSEISSGEGNKVVVYISSPAGIDFIKIKYYFDGEVINEPLVGTINGNKCLIKVFTNSEISGVHKIKAEWAPGISEEFTIEFASDIYLKPKYAGLVSSDSLSVLNDTLTIEGTLYKSYNDLEEVEYLVPITITKPSNLIIDENSIPEIKIGDTTNLWTVSSETFTFDYIVNENSNDFTVEVKWAEGYTQIFTIKIGDITYSDSVKVTEDSVIPNKSTNVLYAGTLYRDLMDLNNSARSLSFYTDFKVNVSSIEGASIVCGSLNNKCEIILQDAVKGEKYTVTITWANDAITTYNIEVSDEAKDVFIVSYINYNGNNDTKMLEEVISGEKAIGYNNITVIATLGTYKGKWKDLATGLEFDFDTKITSDITLEPIFE